MTIKVLVIDDSAVMRKFLSESLSSVLGIDVVGTALDPIIAVEKIKKLQPDVITLDIEMPRMDGLTFLSKLMAANPLPVIMVSTLTEKGANITLKALEEGAVDFLLKPALDNESDKKNFKMILVEKIRGASAARVRRKTVKSMLVEQKYTADVILDKTKVSKKTVSESIIAIGASTGGTEVIDEILSNLPGTVPGIVITQHMPEKFTEAFAQRVNGKSHLEVSEAKNGDRVLNGTALIAPGGKHMLLRADKKGYWIEINDGPAVNRHKPSVDVLFRSASQCASVDSIGILCTGMGNDGAQGLLEMKESGIYTISQDEKSCVVYGMPKEAVGLGASSAEMNVQEIIAYIKKFQ